MKHIYTTFKVTIKKQNPIRQHKFHAAKKSLIKTRLGLTFTLLILIIFFDLSSLNAQTIQFEQIRPKLPAPQIIAEFDAISDGSIAFADVDGDGDQDVLITGKNASNSPISKLYTNDGSGSYTEVFATPFEAVWLSSIAFADVDGDNDQDVLITGYNASNQRIAKLYSNNGNGIFAEVTGVPFEGVIRSSIAFADVDGDNDPDVLITGQNASNLPISKLYTNDGNGSFTEVSATPFEGVWVSSIAFADVDGDGDQDVLITGQNVSNGLIAKLYTNDGSGNYTEVTGTPFEGIVYSSIAFADVDGNGDQDVLITGLNASNQRIAKLYTNNGNGSFAEVTGVPFEGVLDGSIAFADVDGDNDPDVLITGQNASNLPISKLYTNDGNGSFTEVFATPFRGLYRSSVAFADVDGDNDQDLITSAGKLYINDGGIFAVVNDSVIEGVIRSSVAFADVDGDNDLDVLITGSSIVGDISRLYTNNGSGDYTEVASTPFDGVNKGSIAFTDVDGDNDPDVLITGQNGANGLIAKLYKNGGSGNFTEETGTPFEGVYNGSIAFADVDGDNDQDVLITGNVSITSSWGFTSRINNAKLYTNDGSGNYTEVTGTPFEGIYYSSIAFADVDGDNDQDVLITGWDRFNTPIAKLYANNGHGSYTEITGTPFAGVSHGSVAFADVDGDNDQDVIIAGLSGSNQFVTKLYTNDGSGNYSNMNGIPFDGFVGPIAFADVDGDNDQDVLIAGRNYSSESKMKLYTNNGSGSFTEVTSAGFYDGVYSNSINFADVDGNNSLDLLITGNNASRQRIAKLYRNTTLICKIPTTLAATNLTNTSATIGWGDVKPGQDYQLQYRPTNNAQPYATVTATATNTTNISGLLPGTRYKYRVRTVCNFSGTPETTAYSAFAYFTTTLVGCNVPDALIAGGFTNTTADLSWNDVNVGQDYQVQYRPTNNAQPYMYATATGTNSTNVTGLLPGTRYKFRVRAICDLSGTSVTTTYSAFAFFTTTLDGCLVPDGLVAGGFTNTSADLSWNNVNAGQDYQVQYRPTNNAQPYMYATATATNSTNVSGLLPGTRYKFRVRAICDLSGTSVTTDYSAFAFFTTTLTGCNVPDGLAAGGLTNTTANLSWNDVNVGQDYQVQYRPTNNAQPYMYATATGTSSINVSGLLPGTRYKYRVRAICDLGGTSVTTDYSAFAYFTTDIVGCNVPDGLAAGIITTATADISWNDVNTGQDYQVQYRVTDNTEPYMYVTAVATSTTTLSGLTSGKRYKYRVRGICDLGGTSVTTAFSTFDFFTTATGAGARIAGSGSATAPAPTTKEEQAVISDLESIAELHVYPTVTSDRVTIRFSPLEQGKGLMLVYGMQGKIVRELSFTDELQSTLDLGKYGQGLYVVRVLFNDNTFETRIIVQ